jgi:hypothetical protein
LDPRKRQAGKRWIGGGGGRSAWRTRHASHHSLHCW